MFTEIAFPTAVRQLFTYQVPEELFSISLTGKRVWVPYRNSFAIGVVVRTHEHTPDFDTKFIRKVLDESPILSSELLNLTEWIHKFYFCSWGEVIQAALPAGLNFVSKTFVRVATDQNIESVDEQFILEEINKKQEHSHKELQKRWRNTKYLRIYKRLIREGILELWEEPDILVQPKKERWLDWNESKRGEAREFLETLEKRNKWQDSLHKLISEELPAPLKQIRERIGLSDSSLRKLSADEWIRFEEREISSNPVDLDYDPNSIKKLNTEQQEASHQINSAIEKEEFSNFLLYGITGSGKTEVYIHSLRKCLENGKSGIVLVPEIALTPQTVARFYKVFGDQIAILHSRMTNRERLREWKQIEKGEKRIVIGPRSAVFAPVNNLGIIILDEEHDGSYKQIDPAPRYHAREVAIVRANHSNAIVVMGSATPSMQALQMVYQKKATQLSLKKRHAEAVLPEVNIIDLTQYSGAMRGSMSVALFESISESLQKSEQVILLYNRRGFGNYIQCESCGHIPKSPESSVSLTYHKRTNMLMCHYSGYSRKADTSCEACGSDKLLIQGSGTQKIEEELEELFPEARILRFDKDSTSNKGAHEKILSKFGEKEADILVGTQLVAKGLDFPDVTTVGVINADTEQAFPSFNSSERLYQLLSQVSGRSGRGEKKGRVFIQTRQADNPAIQFAKNHDHEGFSLQEMNFRQDLKYPPFSRLIQFVFKGKEERKVVQSAKLMEKIIQQLLPETPTLGPSSSVIGWLNGNYFWEISMKIEPERGANYMEALLEKIMETYNNWSSFSSSVVRVNINVDAQR